MKKYIKISFLIVLSVFVSVPFGVRGQACNGYFLAYNMEGRMDGGYTCWNCGSPFAPNIVIKEHLQGRWADVRFYITDTMGNRLFGVPAAPGFIGYPVGLIYANNRVYWGSLGPHWMGVTSQWWYFGVQRYVMPVPAMYYTNCSYQGTIFVHASGYTYIPNVGDTCRYDTIILFPPCPPLGFADPVPPVAVAPPPPPRVINTYDITGKVAPTGSGLRILQMEDGTFRKRLILDK